MEIAVRGSISRSFRNDKPLDDPFLGKPRSNSSCELTRVEKVETAQKHVALDVILSHSAHDSSEL